MRGVEGSSPPCERPGCDEPAKANGLCRGHYDREREASRHRHRPEKVLLSRARGRATSELVKKYQSEFQLLLAKHLADVKREAENLATTWQGPQAPYDNVTRLRPGPASTLDDETADDRTRLLQPVQCPSCSRFHERGHKCANCVTPLRNAPDRIKALLLDGRSAKWITDQGYAYADVLAVLRQINAERSPRTTDWSGHSTDSVATPQIPRSAS